MVAYLRAQQFTEQNGWQPGGSGLRRMGNGRRPANAAGYGPRGSLDDAVRAGGVARGRRAGVRSGSSSARAFSWSAARISIRGVPRMATAASSSRLPNSIPTKPGTTASTFAATARRRPTASWRCWRSDAAVGRPARDARPQRWLVGHHRDMDVPGFVGEAYQRWPRGLAFYYSAASGAGVSRARTWRPGRPWRRVLRRTQRGDGSWANPENLVKEDDPLIATAFAVRALVR